MCWGGGCSCTPNSEPASSECPVCGNSQCSVTSLNGGGWLGFIRARKCSDSGCNFSRWCPHSGWSAGLSDGARPSHPSCHRGGPHNHTGHGSCPHPPLRPSSAVARPGSHMLQELVEPLRPVSVLGGERVWVRAQEICVLPVTPGSAPGPTVVLQGHHGTLVRRAQDTSSPRWLQPWEGVKCVKLRPSVGLCQLGVCLPSGTPPFW